MNKNNRDHIENLIVLADNVNVYFINSSINNANKKLPIKLLMYNINNIYDTYDNLVVINIIQYKIYHLEIGILKT